MKTVLSLQSSVTFGAVGNTMATAVLAAMGHHCACADTIQLIAHPGHGIRAGGTISDKDFSAMLDGLANLGFESRIGAVMTGYMGTPRQVSIIADFLSRMIAAEPGLDVLVDPAIGDHGRLYVDDDIATNIEEKLIPLATIITPNSFEFGRITGITDMAADRALPAAAAVLKKYSRLQGIAVTGAGYPADDRISDFWIDRNGHKTHEAPRLIHQKDGISGGGDLFAALLMGMRLSGHGWSDAFENAAPLCRRIIDDVDQADVIDIDIDIVNSVLKGRA
jgi:pyridoxine kinase